jgi:hypothetical protein
MMSLIHISNWLWLPLLLLGNISARSDGYANLLSGLGVPGLDRTSSTFNTGPGFLRGMSRYWSLRWTTYELTNLYLTSGLAQRIVDKPADDAFQRGVEIENDEDELMSAEYDRLSVMTRLADAIRWSRLYGGAALILIAQDGGDFTDPLNTDNLDIINEIRVYDMTSIHGTDRYYSDASDPDTFGKLEFYLITPPSAQSFEIHETRLIPVAGEPLPPNMFHVNKVPWTGRSVLEACAKDIGRYERALDWAERLIERKQQAVYQMSGLGEMFANGDDAMVVRRINMVDQVRGNLNSVVVDKDDSYSVLSPGIDGTQAVIEEFQTALASSTGFQVNMLFGKSTKGLNQTNAGDLESHYVMVSHIQEVIAKPPLEKLTSILWLQKDLKSKIPDDWDITFNSLWVPTAKEEADKKLVEQQADNFQEQTLIAFMTNQVLTAEEVRQVVVEEMYSEYEFDPTLPTFPEELNYSANVDVTQMDVPIDPKQPQGKPNAARSTSQFG